MRPLAWGLLARLFPHRIRLLRGKRKRQTKQRKDRNQKPTAELRETLINLMSRQRLTAVNK
jgi:hypothetical protein